MKLRRHSLLALRLTKMKLTTIIFLLITTITPAAAQLSFNYSSFSTKEVNLAGDAFIDKDLQIQVTSGEVGNNLNNVGRVTSPRLMRLWDKSSRNRTAFTAEFSFKIFAQSPVYGDGMAFFLAPPNLPFLKNLTYGGGLGIYLPLSVFQNPVYNSSEYIFVAVEFDTYYNLGVDPSNTTHVGININSRGSNASATWYADILDQKKDYYAKIDYNPSTHNLSVTFTGYRNGTQIDQQLSYQLDLSHYLPEWVMLGFSAATGSSLESHTLKSWSLLSSSQIVNEASPTPRGADSGNPPPEQRSKRGLRVGLGIGLSFFICFIGLAWFLKRKSRASSNEEEYDVDPALDDEFDKGTGPKKFSYKELMRATKNFAEEEKLGQGGFGGVYRGFMRELNSYVAIKRVSRGSRQGIREYATEIKVISQLRHKNLVQLIGWCHVKSDLLLVYEFMPNRSLDFHLYEENNLLTWQVRYNIALGLSSALLYLQESWEQCVLHRDIKSSNIMLDSDFNARLGDFGLARFVDHGKGSQTTIAAGTIGYMAPECAITGKANKESDIFSFGIVALEIACGRKPINLKANEDDERLVEWVWKLYGMGKLLDAADPKLCEDFNNQQMERLMVVGLWCAHPDYKLRPSIRQAIQVLNFEAPLPILANKMPVPTYLPPLHMGFEIESNGTQLSKNDSHNNPSQLASSSKDDSHNNPSQLTSSSTGSTSVAHQRTHSSFI